MFGTFAYASAEYGTAVGSIIAIQFKSGKKAYLFVMKDKTTLFA